MASNITRIAAPSGAGRTRYITNCVISTLFSDEPVLLINLDPHSDPYSADIANLRGHAYYPDFDKTQGDRGPLGCNLTYVCWTPTRSAETPAEEDYAGLLSHLCVESPTPREPYSKHRKTLVVLDGCQCMERPPLAAYASRIRDFASKCVGEGHKLIAVGENDWDTAWLERVMPDPASFRARPMQHWGQPA